MKDSVKLTVAERNTLVELAHLLNEGLGDIAVMLAEPWLQDAPRMTALVRRRVGLRAMQCDPGIDGMTRKMPNGRTPHRGHDRTPRNR
jgi:hypothetical protein